MAISFDRIEPGLVFYEVRRVRQAFGSHIGTYPCRVIEVDREKRTALVSWNNNPPRTWYERDFKRSTIRRSKPKPKR